MLANGGQGLDGNDAAFEITDDQVDQLCGDFCEYDRLSMEQACEDLKNAEDDPFRFLADVLYDLCTDCGKALIVPMIDRFLQPGAQNGGGLCMALSDPCRPGFDDNLPLCGDHLEKEMPGCKEIMEGAAEACSDPETNGAFMTAYRMGTETGVMCYSDAPAALAYAASCQLPGNAPASFVPLPSDFNTDNMTAPGECPVYDGPNCTAAPTPSPTPAVFVETTAAPTEVVVQTVSLEVKESYARAVLGLLSLLVLAK